VRTLQAFCMGLIFTISQPLSNAADRSRSPSKANIGLPSTTVYDVYENSCIRTCANAGDNLKYLALLDAQTSLTS